MSEHMRYEDCPDTHLSPLRGLPSIMTSTSMPACELSMSLGLGRHGSGAGYGRAANTSGMAEGGPNPVYLRWWFAGHKSFPEHALGTKPT